MRQGESAKKCTQLPLGSFLEFSILNIHMEKKSAKEAHLCARIKWTGLCKHYLDQNFTPRESHPHFKNRLIYFIDF